MVSSIVLTCPSSNPPSALPPYNTHPSEPEVEKLEGTTVTPGTKPNIAIIFVQVGKCYNLKPACVMEIKVTCDALPSTDKPGHFADSLKHQTRYAQLTGPNVCYIF